MLVQARLLAARLRADDPIWKTVPALAGHSSRVYLPVLYMGAGMMVGTEYMPCQLDIHVLRSKHRAVPNPSRTTSTDPLSPTWSYLTASTCLHGQAIGALILR
jgi:hypothetical protein